MRRLRGLFRILAFGICLSANLRAFATTALFLSLIWSGSAVADVGFGSARVFSAGANPTAIAVGDFNGDGKPDVVVADNGSPISVLLNNGDGTFTRVTTNMSGLSVAVADFNGDGKLDVAFFSQTTFGVALGNGDGTFSPATTYPLKSGGYPISIAVGDFNGDKSPDVAIAMLNDNAIQLFSNNGNGTFTDHGEILTCGNPASIVIADFNRDGNQDIAVACETSAVTIMLGDGRNGFSNSTIPVFIPGPTSIAAADLNGDGKLDLVTANTNGSSASVFLGNGDGTFTVSAPIALAAKPISVAIADVDGDGKPDVLELTQGVNDLVVLTGKGDGTFNAPAVFNAGGTPLPSWNDRSLVVADFNGDGKPDVVAVTDGLNVSLLLGMGDGTVAPSAQSILTGAGTAWVAAGDVNGDNIADFVVANSAANTVSIFIGQGNNQFTPGATYPVGIDPEFVALADINNDGHLDIVVVCKGNSATPGSVAILLGNGDGTFTPAASLAPGQAPIAAVVADFNGDGKLDVAVVDEGDDRTPSVVAVYLGNGDGSFTGPTDFSVGVSPKAIAAGQLTTTGHIDLVVGNSLNNDVSVLQGNGSGSFTPVATLTLPLGPETSVAIADLNGDGLADVISTGGSGVVVFMNQGNYQFSAGQTYVTEPAVMRVAAGDFDGDGHQDVVAVGQGTGVDLLLGKGDGTFQPYLGFAAGVSPWSFTVADVNNDGLPDVLVATPGVNPLPPSVTILLDAMGLAGSLGASPNPSQYEQPVTFTAKFTPTVRQKFAGTVVFSDSGSALGSVPLDSAGQAQLPAALVAGSHTISALYSGAGFVPLKKTLVQTVTQAPGIIDVASSANPALVGAALTLTATFTGPFGGTGSGAFSFAEGGTTLTSGIANSSGQGTLSKANWPAGPHAITVTYSGDANLAPATVTYSQDIQNPTTTTLTSPATAVFGASVTLTAVVTAAAAPVPTGTVDFVADGSSILGSPSLEPSGQAILSTNSIPDGVHTVTAKYRGDSYSTASTAQATSLSVADFGMTAQPNSETLRAGQSATMTIAISGIAGFSSQVSLACSNVPALATCTFTPPTVTAATSPATSTLVIKTAGTAVALLTPPTVPLSQRTEIALALVGFGAFGIAWAGASVRKRYATVGILVIPLILALASCGGGGNNTPPPPPVPSTPTGTTNIIVTGTSSMNGTSVSHQLPVTITVAP